MSAIKAGDVVIITKPRPCGCAGHIGLIFQVAKIGHYDSQVCLYCAAALPGAWAAQDPKTKHYVALSRLTKIDPLVIPESVERYERVPA